MTPTAKGPFGRRREGSARPGLDKADLRHGQLRIAVRRRHKHDIERHRLRGLRRLGLHAVAVFASEPVERDRAVMGLEPDAVVRVVCEDFSFVLTTSQASSPSLIGCMIFSGVTPRFSSASVSAPSPLTPDR